MRFVLALIAVVALMATAFAADPAVRVELRASESEPGEGLTQMTSADGMVIYVAATPIITNAHIEQASVGEDGVSGRPVVNIRLNDEGADLFGAYTAGNVGKRVAILIDGTLVSAPQLNEPILGGSLQISGNFTLEEAERIANGIEAAN